jgi:signal transduction histidine kinase
LLTVYFGLKGPSPVQPLAKQGYLDLSGWDFEKNGNVKLDGEWEFYRNKLLTPEDLSKSGAAIPNGTIKVPSSWRGKDGEARLSGEGAATYRLKVHLADGMAEMGLKTTSIRMSYRVFVNGALLLSSGRPALSKAGYVMANTPYSASFNPGGTDLEIVVQAADFDFREGGIVQSLYLGTQQDIYTLAVRNNFIEGFLAACLFITGLYYFFVFWGRRKDLGVLYYSAYALTYSLFELMYGEKILFQMSRSLSEQYSILLRVHNVLTYLTVIFACLFIHKIAEKTVPHWFVKAVLILFGGYSVCFMVLPLSLVAEYQNAALLLGMGTYVVIVIVLLLAYARRQYGTLEKSGLARLLIAFTCVLVYFLNGTLYINNVMNDNYIGDMAMLVFIAMISSLLSGQYNRSFNANEKMSVELLALDRLKDEFLANTSHELRTPLNGIINITNSIIESEKGKLDAAQRRNLHVVVSAARRLYNLINDILDISSLKNGEIRLYKRPVDLRSMADSTLYIMEQSKNTKEIKFVNSVPEGSQPVQADVERLRQIFYNLLGKCPQIHKGRPDWGRRGSKTGYGRCLD